MKQLLHIPSPKTKYLIKEIKINYGVCTARCYHACPPAAALFAAPGSQQSSSRTIPPGRGCTSTSHPFPSHLWGLSLGKSSLCAEGRAQKPVSWCVVSDSKCAVVFRNRGLGAFTLQWSFRVRQYINTKEAKLLTSLKASVRVFWWLLVLG